MNKTPQQILCEEYIKKPYPVVNGDTKEVLWEETGILCMHCKLFSAGKDEDTWLGPGEYYTSCESEIESVQEDFDNVLYGAPYCEGFTTKV